jgi:dienelactone hydrolase
MLRRRALTMVVVLVLTSGLAMGAEGLAPRWPETVEVHNGSITLHALLWRPQGRGPFPAVLFNHGSGRTRQELERLGPYEEQADVLGPVFARHGYVFLYLFRRGVGLSADQGANAVDRMNAEFAAHGQEARNALQVRLLENQEMSDALSGLTYLRTLPEVDTSRIGVIGHSFGGSLTFLLAAREPKLRAVVIFSNAGYSWDRSAALRNRLNDDAVYITAPVFFIHAANDFSIAPGKDLDARLAQLGKPHLLKVYPPVGHTVEDGHGFLYLGVSTWERDVFAFLDKQMRK